VLHTVGDERVRVVVEELCALYHEVGDVLLDHQRARGLARGPDAAQRVIDNLSKVIMRLVADTPSDGTHWLSPEAISIFLSSTPPGISRA
jgi:plasmid stabilization system protein ParE